MSEMKGDGKGTSEQVCGSKVSGDEMREKKTRVILDARRTSQFNELMSTDAARRTQDAGRRTQAQDAGAGRRTQAQDNNNSKSMFVYLSSLPVHLNHSFISSPLLRLP